MSWWLKWCRKNEVSKKFLKRNSNAGDVTTDMIRDSQYLFHLSSFQALFLVSSSVIWYLVFTLMRIFISIKFQKFHSAKIHFEYMYLLFFLFLSDLIHTIRIVSEFLEWFRLRFIIWELTNIIRSRFILRIFFLRWNRIFF